MNNKPYVGITGPVNEQEVKDIVNSFYNNNYTMNTSHIPMLGFLVSYKTLNGIPGNRRYPKFEELPKLLSYTNNKVFTMIHYNTKEQDTLADQVSKIFELDNIYDLGLCKSIQMNIVWPDIAQVDKIKDKFPEMKIVFQLSSKAMEGSEITDIVKKISAYKKSIDYVLIDPSGGSGTDFDTDTSAKIYFELQNNAPYLSVGFAGGLSGENINKKVQDLIYKVQNKNFCIDAEGRLRDKITDEYGDDVLNVSKVEKYLVAASKILP